MKHFYKFLCLIVAISVASACVTQRKKDEAKGLKLFMHNLTAKYNGFFNADVLVKNSFEKLTLQHQDNYNKILEVYPYVTVDNVQGAAPDLDKAIEKLAVAATFHRPSHWTDDSYLMLGKAQYLKHDYAAAEESFQYLVDVYDPNIKAKMTPKQRKELAEENRKAKEEARKDAAKQKKIDKEEKDKARKVELEQAKKDKEDAAKKAKEDLEKRNKDKEEERKKAEEAAKKERENKKESLADRNEARRKANEERRLENERKRKEALKQGKNKTTQPKDTEGIANETPKETQPKEKPKLTPVKTGSNGTPIAKAESDIKVSKKKGKPDKYFLKHRPCFQEGVLWLALTKIERQNFNEAQLLLEDLEKNPKTFKDIRAQVARAKAHLFLKQNNYEAAIPALEGALKLTKKKREKARLAYILAQIHQTNNNSDKAYATFDKVLDYSPVYEMEFNARLSMALNSSNSADNTTAMLKKMSKDFKNREYGDQIYFALAQIALKNNQKPEAISYLKEALTSGGKNKQQKAEVYYLLAKLQYESEKYVEAKAYYDSTVQVIPASDPRKSEAERYATNLVEISRNIQIITLQDSLLHIAAMPEKEKRNVAINIKKARLEKAAAALVVPRSNGGANNSDLPALPGESKSTFFAYNLDAVKKGKKEFEKKWGTDRKLEDNWRRSNKKGSSNDALNPEIASSEITDREVAEILKDVPKSAAEIDAAKLKIDDALFQLGTLYHDKLKNEKKSIEALDQDLTRFPATKHELDDWYYLYLTNISIGNKTKANEYFEKLQTKYPTSNYAQLLKNPDAFNKNDEKAVEKFYADTYTAFKKGDYKTATQRITESETLFGINNPLKAKFALLNAMCIGHTSGREGYMTALKDVIAKYADTPEEKRAKDILRILEFGAPVTEAPKNDILTTTNFRPDDDKYHYILIVLAKDAPLEDAKSIISDYNSKYHRLDDLKLSNISLNADTEIPILVIRRLKDKAAALVYTEGSKKNAADFLKGMQYEVFAVTQDNYREILRLKSVEQYRKFYAQYYEKN